MIVGEQKGSRIQRADLSKEVVLGISSVGELETSSNRGSKTIETRP